MTPRPDCALSVRNVKPAKPHRGAVIRIGQRPIKRSVEFAKPRRGDIVDAALSGLVFADALPSAGRCPALLIHKAFSLGARFRHCGTALILKTSRTPPAPSRHTCQWLFLEWRSAKRCTPLFRSRCIAV